MIVRKAHKDEMENIIKVANKSFATVRYDNYNFKQTIPYIYNSNKNFSDIHYVCENDNHEIVSVGGNLIRNIKVNGKSYIFSNIGTISTIPEFRNRGCMSMMMPKFDQENIDKDVIFSILTGDRKRYLHFGFEKSMYSCKIELSTKFLDELSSLKVSPLQEEKTDIVDNIYKIYCQNIKLILRKRDDFIEFLKSKRHQIFILQNEQDIIGYFSVNKELDCVDEFYVKSISLIKSSLKAIVNYFDGKLLKIFVNLMDKDYFEEIRKYAEQVTFFDDINIKVYNMKKFIEFAFLCTKEIKNFKNSSYIYKIDDKTYKIKIHNNNIKIKEGNFKADNIFTSIQFVDYVLNPTNCYDDEKLTFVLDFDYADLF